MLYELWRFKSFLPHRWFVNTPPTLERCAWGKLLKIGDSRPATLIYAVSLMEKVPAYEAVDRGSTPLLRAIKRE